MPVRNTKHLCEPSYLRDLMEDIDRYKFLLDMDKDIAVKHPQIRSESSVGRGQSAVPGGEILPSPFAVRLYQSQARMYE